MASPKDCVHCGVCRENCDFLTKYGIDIGDTDKLRELAYHCFLCGKCTEVCPIGIDGRAEVMRLRNEYGKDHLPELEEKYKWAFAEKRNYKYRNWKNVTAGSVFFPGCNFPSLFPKTSDKLSKLFAEYGIGTVYECCGKPVAELGSVADDVRIIDEIKTRLQENNITEIIMACPNCWGHLSDRLGVKLTTVFAKLSELGLGEQVDEDVKFFVPCPDRLSKSWVEDIRPFINGEVTCVDGIQCCGLGGHAGHVEPELSQGFADRFKERNEGQVYAYCASCTGRFKRNGLDSVDHIITKIVGTNEKASTSVSYLNRVKTKFK